MVCSVVPDLDVIGFYFGIPYGDLWGHRGLTHSLPFAGVLSALFVGLLYSIVFSFTDFSAVWLLTQGGPYNTTHVFGTYAYNIGINAGDIGMGAAITLFIFPFLAAIVIVMLRFLRRE